MTTLEKQIDLAEQIVLSLCMNDPENMKRCIDSGLSMIHFESPSHKIIFHSMTQLEKEGKPFGESELAVKHFNLAGVVKMIAERPADPRGIDEHVAAIINSSWRRHVVSSFKRVSELSESFDAYADPEPIRRSLERDLNNLTLGTNKRLSGMKSYFEIWMKDKDVLDAQVKAFEDGRTLAVPTGFPKLDSYIGGGLQEASLYVVGARTNVGKSTFVGVIAKNAGAAGKYVCIYPTETTDANTFRKTISDIAKVETDKVMWGRLSKEERNRFYGAAEIVTKWNIGVNDELRFNFEEIVSDIRYNKRIGKCDLVIIDYLQHLRQSRGKNETRLEELTRIVADLKSLAKELKIPILCTAQLNRDAATNKTPGMHNIKDCGAVEQDGDVVMLLWHEEPTAQNSGEKRKTILSIDKNRFGPALLEIELDSELQYSRMKEREENRSVWP